MKTCSICHHEFMHDENIVANAMQTFIYKPADVPDVKTFMPDGKGGHREISTAAMLDPDSLRESRKAYKRTEMASVFMRFDEQNIRNDLFNIRHLTCSVQRTAQAMGEVHPVLKHAIRYKRSMVRK